MRAENLAPPGLDPWAIWHVACHSTNYTITAQWSFQIASLPIFWEVCPRRTIAHAQNFITNHGRNFTVFATYIHTYIHDIYNMYLHIYIHMYIPTYAHTYICTYIHTYVCTYLTIKHLKTIFFANHNATTHNHPFVVPTWQEFISKVFLSCLMK